MRLPPRTLFGRLALFMVAVVAVSHVLVFLAVQKYRHDSIDDHFYHFADDRLRTASLLLSLTSPEKVASYFAEDGPRAYLRPADSWSPPGGGPLPPDIAYTEKLLQEKWGPETFLRRVEGQEEGMAIGFTAQNKPWWLVMPRPRHHVEETPWGLFAAFIAYAILALAATAWISWHISRPLAAIGRAARRFGAGERPEPVTPTGPEDVRRLAGDFNHMLEDLARHEKERQELLAGVSHDLRAPITRMSLRAELIDEAGERDAWLRDVDSLNRIVEQFLGYVRGDAQEAPAPMRLDEIVEPIVEDYRRLGHDIHCRSDSATALPLRKLAIERMVVNLIENALEYGRPPLEIAIAEDGDGISLSLRDHGPGMDPEQAAKASEPFVRLASDRGGNGHCGLGLAIVSRVARLHGAEVIFDKPTDGAFTVRVLWRRG